MARRTYILVSLASLLLCETRADVIDDWNDAMLNAIRRENTSPPQASRNLAILQLAIYDALNSIERSHEPYLELVPLRGAVSPHIAAASASYRAATSLFPSEKATFDALWQSDLAQIKSEQQRTNGIALGFAAAEALLDLRASDIAQTTVTYFPSNQPGAWRRTLPFHRPPDLSHWGRLKPFAISHCNQFLPPPPPPLASHEYDTDFNRAKLIGAKKSVSRTAYETETAQFWSDFSGTVTPPGHWNQIARSIANNEKLTLHAKARLLALLNLAMADAAIVCWDAKYKFNFWRPVTAIRRAAEDNNPETVADREWEPLLITPAFPEYVSGHSTFSGAAGEVLLRYFGRDNVRVTVSSDTLPGVTRSYESISAVVAEIGHSRVLGGIHFPSADTSGQKMGRAVGAYLCERVLRPRHLHAAHGDVSRRMEREMVPPRSNGLVTDVQAPKASNGFPNPSIAFK